METTLEKRIWENWDIGEVANIIDKFWAESEFGWRETEVEDMLKHFPKNSPILEVGCGSGLLCETMLRMGLIVPNAYVGGDTSQKLLALARKRLPEIAFIELDIFNLAMADKSHSNTICVQVLQHLPYYLEAIKELIRVTKEKLYIISWFDNTDRDDLNFVQVEKFENQYFQSNCYSLPRFLDHLRTYKEVKNIKVTCLDEARNYSICVEL